MKRYPAVFLAVVLFAAFAQSQQVKSIFGIELRQPIALPECKRVQIVLTKDVKKWTHEKAGEEEWFYDESPSKTCVEPEFDDKPRVSGGGTTVHRGDQAKPVDSLKWWAVIFPIANSPEIVSRGQVSTFMVAGKVEAIRFKTPPNDERVIAALIKKFGETTGSSTKELQNGFGARFVVTFATWERDDLLIRYCSGYCYPGEDDGNVEIGTKIAQDYLEKLRRDYDQAHPKPAF